MHKAFLTLALFVITTTSAHAEAPTIQNVQNKTFVGTVDDMKPLVLMALRAGEAHGILAGDAALFIKNKMGATTPLRVNVTTIKRYNQPGCARLNAQFLQDAVTLPGEQKAKNQEVDFQFNYCMDGSPPRTEGKEYVINNPFGQGQGGASPMFAPAQ